MKDTVTAFLAGACIGCWVWLFAVFLPYIVINHPPRTKVLKDWEPALMVCRTLQGPGGYSPYQECNCLVFDRAAEEGAHRGLVMTGWVSMATTTPSPTVRDSVCWCSSPTEILSRYGQRM